MQSDSLTKLISNINQIREEPMQVANEKQNVELWSGKVTAYPREYFFKPCQWSYVVSIQVKSDSRSQVARTVEQTNWVGVRKAEFVRFLNEFFITHCFTKGNKLCIFSGLVICLYSLLCWAVNHGEERKNCHESTINKCPRHLGKNNCAKKQLTKCNNSVNSAPESTQIGFEIPVVMNGEYDLVTAHCCFLNALVVGRGLLVRSLVCLGYKFPHCLTRRTNTYQNPSIGDYLVANAVYWLFGRTSSNRGSLCVLA